MNVAISDGAAAMNRFHLPIHVLITLGLGSAFVATPLPINLGPLLIWAVLLGGWGRRKAIAAGPRAGHFELALQIGVMILLIVAAALAPGKTVDEVKGRHITLPRAEMTLGELHENTEVDSHTMPRWIHFPEDQTGQLIRFPARQLTVGELIAAIEEQTPFRHQFHHCGNGSTILWGGDCSFGLWFCLRK